MNEDLFQAIGLKRLSASKTNIGQMLAIGFLDTILTRTNLVTNPFWQKILSP